MLSPQQIGINFETDVHHFLSKTKLKVLREKDIRNKYGQHISAIDHLIDDDNLCIMIQTKYENTNVSISKMNHFIKCTQDINNIIKKKCICIYFSKMDLSSHSKIALEEENNKLSNRKYYHITGNNDKEMFSKLSDFFYLYLQIFFYENDNSCIMLD